MARVTWVIPARNAARTLVPTLRSLVEQTFSDWQAIIVDDGSDDLTAAIAEQWCEADDRICLINANVQNVSLARNLGAAQATSPWLAFLDADDLLTRTHVGTFMRTALDSEADFIYANRALLSPDGRLGKPLIPPASDHFQHLARYNCFCTHACMLRRAVFDELGGFDASLKASEDWDLWQRCARTALRFAYINECVAIYRMRPDSLSRDPEIVFETAREVIYRAHRADHRVPNALPQYATGLPSEGADQAVIGIAIWCAGLILGSGGDPTAFLRKRYAELSNHHVEIEPIVSMIQGSIPAGACCIQEDWPLLWPEFRGPVAQMLEFIEFKSRLAGLASACMQELERRTIRAADTAGWSLNLRTARTSAGSTAWRQEQSAERFLRSITKPDVRAVALIVAHPDDDIIGAGALMKCWPNLQVLYATDGAPKDIRFAREAGFSNVKTYANARRAEAEAALSLLGLRPNAITGLGFLDQEVSFHLIELTNAVRGFFQSERPEIVITHPYEGGHPDHDAVCFAVHAACAQLKAAGHESPEIIEMTSYFGREGKRVTGSFLDEQGPAVCMYVDQESTELKRRMLSCHVSQHNLLKHFPLEAARFRCAPAYNFFSPPHAEKLLYETVEFGVDGESWRSLAQKASKTLAEEIRWLT